MNERIKQLSLQASDSIPDDVSAEHAMYLFQTKFAELIVRECADYIDAFNREHMVEEGIGGNMLKQHFGVEE